MRFGTILRSTVFAAATLCLLSAVSAQAADAEKKNLVIGSATLGSSGYMHWEACAYLVNKYSTALKASSVSTSGSTESVFLLDRKNIHVGHGTSIEVVAGNEGTAPFKKKYPIWQIFGWNENALPAMVLDKNKDIRTYSDLKGRQVCFAKKGSGTESMFTNMFKTLGLYKEVKRSYLGFSAAYDALVDGLVDAAPGNFQGGIPTPAVLDLGARAKYRILSLTEEEMAAIQAKAPFISRIILPRSAYEGMTEDVISPGLPLVGITTPDVEDDVIYEFVKAVLEHTDELHKISVVSAPLTPETAVRMLVPGYPVHPGAVRYYKEKGLWTDNLVEGRR